MASFSRSAVLEWTGDVARGTGRAAAASGAFATNATFPRLAGEPAGATTPEELLAASHATCLSGVEPAALEEIARAAEEACTISALLRPTVRVSVSVRPGAAA
jgi:organic hydroperoxide reductase OsmC/OhrA